MFFGSPFGIWYAGFCLCDLLRDSLQDSLWNLLWNLSWDV